MARMDPVPRLPELDDYAGQWVLVKDGKVIASAPDSVSIVGEWRQLGEAGKGAVCQYAHPASEVTDMGSL